MSALLDAVVLGPFDERQIGLMVGWLDADTRATLALGPTPEDHEEGECCRVCVAFRPMKRWAGAVADAVLAEGGDPAAPVPMSSSQRRRFTCSLLLDYWHQGDDLAPYGYIAGTGTICFERCLMIYRAAGWVE